MPLSVVMLTDEIYSAFYCDYTEGKSFLDSHSYSGNALACAAANATLDIFEDENIIESNKPTIELIAKQLKHLEQMPLVTKTRQRGMIAAIELGTFSSADRVNLQIYSYALSQGILIRPLGNVIYLMPPYTMTHDEILRVFEVITEAIERLT